jgi:GNAT superfamily N-acetyltransferase
MLGCGAGSPGAGIPAHQTMNNAESVRISNDLKAADLTVRIMRPADIPDAMRLREYAGWNQTEADWLRLLDLEPHGCFVACEGDRVRGTVTTLQYGKRFAWIGMLLTDPGSRRRGIGTLLLRRSIFHLEDDGVGVLRLDGTPMGYHLYEKHGFVDEYEIQRWEGLSTVEKSTGVPVLQASDLDRVCEWDQHIFGVDRSRLITSLWTENPSCSAIARDGGELAGYGLWRPGSRAWYMGPCAATSAESTVKLVVAMLSRMTGAHVFVDVCIKNPWALQLLNSMGFKCQRSLVRMYRGPHDSPGKPELVFSIAGPELG